MIQSITADFQAVDGETYIHVLLNLPYKEFMQRKQITPSMNKRYQNGHLKVLTLYRAAAAWLKMPHI
jgi:hypothetical protein